MSKRKKNVDSLLAVTADYSANAAWYEITEAGSHNATQCEHPRKMNERRINNIWNKSGERMRSAAERCMLVLHGAVSGRRCWRVG